jgi:hypothetical protein
MPVITRWTQCTLCDHVQMDVIVCVEPTAVAEMECGHTYADGREISANRAFDADVRQIIEHA